MQFSDLVESHINYLDLGKYIDPADAVSRRSFELGKQVCTVCGSAEFEHTPGFACESGVRYFGRNILSHITVTGLPSAS